MCGADIPDISELDGIDKEGDRKTRSERKNPDKTPTISPPVGD